MASVAELEERLAALEERKIAVADLPLQQLIRKIELLGLDPSVLTSQGPAASYLAVNGSGQWRIDVADSAAVTALAAGAYGGPLHFAYPFNSAFVIPIPIVLDGGSAAGVSTSVVISSGTPLDLNVYFRNNGTAAANFGIRLVTISKN